MCRHKRHHTLLGQYESTHCMFLKRSALLRHHPQHSLQLISAETPCLKAMAYAYVTSGAKVRGEAGAVRYIICLTSVS